MSIVSSELAGSSQLTLDTSGKYTAKRSWIVYDEDGGPVNPTEAMAADGMPALGDQHPELETLFAGGWSLQLQEDRADTWQVDWNYTSYSTTYPDLGGDEPIPLGIDGFNMSVAVTIIDIWKSEPSIPSTPATINNPARTDIGGTLVGEGGYPVSMSLPTADISVRVLTSGFISGGDAMANVGKRNTGTWQGFAAGSVLFTGMNVDQSRDGINNIEYRLAWDYWYHLRQAPERDADGKVTVDASGDPPQINVFFKQPFPETSSFGFLPI